MSCVDSNVSKLVYKYIERYRNQSSSCVDRNVVVSWFINTLKDIGTSPCRVLIVMLVSWFINTLKDIGTSPRRVLIEML